MAAYVLIEARVSDPASFEKYKKLAEEAIGKYQGRFLARGGPVEVLEGSWTKPERLVIIEFESVAQAKKFYNSPEYGSARELRKDAAIMNMLVIDGLSLMSV
ncbi:conserved hypothetical protein [Candidatus Propionivibrio aalborgensis]|jgi:uncharacterized protein (DUF1330 family)|uniref:DUF1330 domain-containing protein n=2 Tax=Candidatus Propionivibrio aalborgensis TaxID=1860101 RepID=A0A1A8XZ66_9RHOO|nr:DUF1330 domain-containing protein [Propionivibrio sp.]MBK7565838.1 DUF1330 domain-containing protein [Propionivibrio sp.]MBK9026597.1 DUF1330 domain-containing protein [Propionivibrio sp.]MBP6422212.1 DUF1330 domain-containing protein [Propionivibrio sp.]SBT10001.1 conserved hypothetical protein [Candidatus Propionivibrio aalborgensis]